MMTLPRAISRLTYAIKTRMTARVVAFVMSAWPGGVAPEYFDRTFINYVKEGYKRNEIIYACITLTAKTAASVALQVRRKADDVHLLDHDLQALLQRPNDMSTEYEFWVQTITFMMLAGVCYWQKIRDRSGRVLSLWPVRPDYVRPDVREGQGLIGYIVNINGVNVATIPAEDMVVFRLPDPLDIFGKTSPLEVLARTADVDNSITDLLKMMMQRGAIPMGFLVSKMRLTDDAVTDIRRRLEERYGGYANWTTPGVLDSDMSYQRVGMTMEEMKSSDLDARAEARICMVYGIPPILIGTTFGLARSTHSNYEEARLQWWEDNLSALYKQLADGIQMQLAPDFGDDVVTRWDFSKVPALQSDRDKRWTRANGAFEKGTITRNEARKEMGLPSLGKEGNVLKEGSMDVYAPNDPADDQPIESENENIASEETPTAEAKALSTDAQRRWFFANNPQYASQGDMPKLEEGADPEAHRQALERFAETSTSRTSNYLWDKGMIKYSSEGKVVVDPEHTRQAAKGLVTDTRDAQYPRNYIVSSARDYYGLHDKNDQQVEGHINREKAAHAQAVLLASHVGGVSLTEAQHRYVTSVAGGNYLKEKYAQYDSGDRGTLQGVAGPKMSGGRSEYSEHMRQVHRRDFVEVQQRGKAIRIIHAEFKQDQAGQDCYALLSLANHPSLVAIQDKLKAQRPEIEWADPADFHVTLVYASGVSDLQTVRNVLPQSINPLTFEVGPIGTFPGDQAKQPILLTVAATPELKALQSGLYASFKSLELGLSDYSDPERWNPHITLGYMPTGSALPDYPETVSVSSKSIQCSVAKGAAFDVIYTTKAVPLRHRVEVTDQDVLAAKAALKTLGVEFAHA